MPKPNGPSRFFHRAPRRDGLRRLASRVHAVHHDTAELVDDQVHRARLPGQQRGGGLGRVERDLERSREVVTGAERDQAQGALRELVTPVQRRDDRVQAAVAARDHDRAGAGPVEHSVELSRVAGGRDLDVRVLAEDPQRHLERVVVGTAALGVGADQQQRVDAGHPRRGLSRPREMEVHPPRCP